MILDFGLTGDRRFFGRMQVLRPCLSAKTKTPPTSSYRCGRQKRNQNFFNYLVEPKFYSLFRPASGKRPRQQGSNDPGDPEHVPQLLDGPSANEQGDSGAAGRVDRCVGDRDADQMYQGEAQPDSDGRQPQGRTLVGGAMDDQQEHEGHDDFAQESCTERVPSRRVGAIAVGGEACEHVEARLAAGNEIQNRSAGNTPEHLCENIRHQVLSGKRPPAQSPMETAGLRWQPEICPTAKAMVSTVSPNASETPSRPMPTFGNAAASTALPQPPKTSQKVPKNSAPSCRVFIAIASAASGR